MAKQRTLARFEKNALEVVKIDLVQYRDDLYLDLRIWIQESPSSPGSETPTKKGIRLHIELLPCLLKNLQAAQAAIEGD